MRLSSSPTNLLPTLRPPTMPHALSCSLNPLPSLPPPISSGSVNSAGLTSQPAAAAAAHMRLSSSSSPSKSPVKPLLPRSSSRRAGAPLPHRLRFPLLAVVATSLLAVVIVAARGGDAAAPHQDGGIMIPRSSSSSWRTRTTTEEETDQTDQQCVSNNREHVPRLCRRRRFP